MISLLSENILIVSFQFVKIITLIGHIHQLNTCMYCNNTCKYCGNTHENWPNTWKMCLPASAIFASVVAILVSFEAILMYFSNFVVDHYFEIDFQSWFLQKPLQNCFKTYDYYDNTREYCTCRWPIFQALAQYSWILPQYLRVLSQYLPALSRWINP